MRIAKLLIATTLAAGTFAAAAQADDLQAGPYKHVLLLSVDGLHETDLANFIAANSDSALAGLAAHGVHYAAASSAKPSDSFPGLLAIVTGGSPGTMSTTAVSVCLPSTASCCCAAGR